MSRISYVLAAAALVVATAAPAQETASGASQVSNPQAPAASQTITAQQTSNPELVAALAERLGATPTQAEGAAGVLFTAAKSRLKSQDWSQVARAIPGIDGLLQAAPPVDANGGGGDIGALSSALGLGELGGVASAFQKLGLNPELVALAVPVITNYVSRNASPELAQVLQSALNVK